MHDGAFYLAGYSVELMLKAAICEKLGMPNLFDEEEKADGKGEESRKKEISEIRKVLKTHNLFILLVFSGLKVKFDNEKSSNSELAIENSALFNDWNEGVRYKPCGFTRHEDIDVGKLLTSLSNKTGLLAWIQSN